MNLIVTLLALLVAVSCNQISFTADGSPKDNPVESSPAVFSCPTGYAKVDDELCVMTYEARKNSDNKPESRGDVIAWHSVTTVTALAACASLNVPAHPEGVFALINNDEWIKIANQIELNGENWSNGLPYDGCLKRGTAGSYDAEICINTGSSTPVWGPTRNSTIGNLKLASGETIYDFSGNYFEVIDAQVTQGNKPYASSVSYPDWIPVQNELYLVDTHLGASYPFSLETVHPLNPALRASDGIGTFNNRTDPGNTDPLVLRGGVSWGSAGIYDLYLSRAATQTDPDVSFRCVFRKNP